MGYHLLWQDYIVFVAFLVGSLVIGLYHGMNGDKQKTTKEFLVGNRKLSVIPTTLSLMVSFQSAIMFLGFVAEMSTHGFSVWPGYCVSVGLSLLITERFILPVFYPLKLTSIFEYLDLRYNSQSLRILASFFGILSGIIYMSLAMYAPCMALKYLSGIDLYVTVPLMAIICICYTAIGGIKAVIWTDVFQCIVMFGGTLIIVIKGTYDIGGISHVFSTAIEHGRMQSVPWSLDPRERHTMWGYGIGFTCFWLSGFGLSQASVQRYCATPTMKQARKVVLLTIGAVFCMASLVCYCGLIVFTYNVDTGCDPVASKHIKSPNILFPVYIIKAFGELKGFTGVFMAMLYGGALSSISSSLSGSSANTWEDVLKPRLPNISELHASFITKIIVIIYGIIAVLFVFVLDQFPGTIVKVATQLMGAMASPLFGLFVMALCFRTSEHIGAIIGTLSGLTSVMIVCIGSTMVRSHGSRLPSTGTSGCYAANLTSSAVLGNVTHLATKTLKPEASGFTHLFTISYMWYLPLGAFVTIVVGLAVSTYIKWKYEDDQQLPDSLFINFRRAFNCSNDTRNDEGDFKINGNEFEIEVCSDSMKKSSSQGEKLMNKEDLNGNHLKNNTNITNL